MLFVTLLQLFPVMIPPHHSQEFIICCELDDVVKGVAVILCIFIAL